jgi:hypothetical protein
MQFGSQFASEHLICYLLGDGPSFIRAKLHLKTRIVEFPDIKQIFEHSLNDVVGVRVVEVL